MRKLQFPKGFPGKILQQPETPADFAAVVRICKVCPGGQTLDGDYIGVRRHDSEGFREINHNFRLLIDSVRCATKPMLAYERSS
jgi:hypothetical protein